MNTAPDHYAQLRVSFDPKHLEPLSHFMAHHDIRYYLNGIRVEPAEKGAYLIATNGHILLAIHDSTATMKWPGHKGEGIVCAIEPGAVTAARATTRRQADKKLRGARVMIAGRRLKVAVPTDHDAPHDGELFIQARPCIIEGKFPDWRKVLPDFSTLQRGGFRGNTQTVNAHYLALLEKLTQPQRRFVSLWQSPQKPEATFVQFDAAPEMLAVIMAARGDADETSLSRVPDFGKSNEPAKTSAPAAAEVVNRDAEPVTA